jgi:PTS system nitrogen regulatory IIA component
MGEPLSFQLTAARGQGHAMQLSVNDVTQLCDVSEKTVYRWIQEDGLPAERVNSLYRINPAELLEWATTRHLPVSPAIFRKLNGDCVERGGLSDALELGGVVEVRGGDRRGVFGALVEGIGLPDGFAADTLVQLLVAREKLGSTAVGGGIAIPHPRHPLVLPGARQVLRVGYLTPPIDFSAPDGRPVDTLFLMICPTVHDHLQLLARLASVLRREALRKLLAERPDKGELLPVIRAEELALEKESGR